MNKRESKNGIIHLTNKTKTQNDKFEDKDVNGDLKNKTENNLVAKSIGSLITQLRRIM